MGTGTGSMVNPIWLQLLAEEEVIREVTGMKIQLDTYQSTEVIQQNKKELEVICEQLESFWNKYPFAIVDVM